MKTLYVVLMSSYIFMLFSLLTLNEYMPVGVSCRCVTRNFSGQGKFLKIRALR